MHNYNPSCIQLLKKNFSENLLLVRLFVRTNLFIASRFLDYRYEIWHLMSALCSDVRKKNIYRCTSRYSALNYCSGIFFQIPQLSTRSGAHKLFRRLFEFSQFWTAISRKLWRRLATNMRSKQCIWKRNPFWKKTIHSEKKTPKTSSKSTHKSSHNTCLNYVPHAQADQAWHTKKHQFSLLQPARIVRSPPNCENCIKIAFPPVFTDWREILHSQADPGARRYFKVWPESVQRVAPAVRKTWFLACE